MEALLEGFRDSGVDKINESTACTHLALKFHWQIQEIILALEAMLIKQTHEHVPCECLWHLLHNDCGEAFMAGLRRAITTGCAGRCQTATTQSTICPRERL